MWRALALRRVATNLAREDLYFQLSRPPDPDVQPLQTMGDHIKLKSNEYAGRRVVSALRAHLHYVLAILAGSILVWWSSAAVGPNVMGQQGPPSDIAGRYEGFAESKNY